MTKLPAQKVGGLIDGMAVLQVLATNHQPVSGASLARQLQLSPVRVNRLLKTFAYLGYAHQDASRRYTVGPAIHVIAAQTMNASGLLRRAFGYLEKLNEEAPTVALGMLWRDKVCYLFHKTAAMPMAAGIGNESLFKAEESSIGLALLAALPDEAVEAIYRGRLPAALPAQLNRTRAEGHALVRHGDHYSMAVAIGSPAYAGLAATGLKEQSQLPAILARLRDYAEKITNEPED